MSDHLIDALGYRMVDAIGCIVAGFESEPARVSARIGRMNQSSLKSTVLGYGITTNPESAAFANSSMVRHTDFNDGALGGHNSVMIPGVLAIGEAFHSTGLQVLGAVALAYEFAGACASAGQKLEGPGGTHGWDAPYEGLATALACGKLMGLNEDQLGNALSIAVVNVPMNVPHTGALSHWKGCHSAISVRTGVYASLLAREGMTGPSWPFEGRNGMWDNVTGPFELRIPVFPDGQMVIAKVDTGTESTGYKRYPAEGNSQAVLEVIPEIREWTKAQDIASIRVDMPALEEIADPPKWDPRNRETADHSMAFLMSVALIDGEVYLSSFTPKRYIEDTAVRQLMEKVTCWQNLDYKGHRMRITVQKKSGEKLVKDVFKEKPMSHQEIYAKFNRVCDYMSVKTEQRDRALKTWSNLRAVKDIAEPMRDFANFGKPVPL
jgi:2-methylcitrate dehydratase